MREASAITYANTFDPTGGIWPTRDVHGQTLAKPLDVGKALNEFQPILLKDAQAFEQINNKEAQAFQPPSPIASEQVRNTKPPVAFTPNGPIKKAQAAITHHGTMKKDAERVADGLKARGIELAHKRIAGRAVIPAHVMQKLNRINRQALKTGQVSRGCGSERGW